VFPERAVPALGNPVTSKFSAPNPIESKAFCFLPGRGLEFNLGVHKATVVA
jgi:hypothetical protein